MLVLFSHLFCINTKLPMLVFFQHRYKCHILFLCNLILNLVVWGAVDPYMLVVFWYLYGRLAGGRGPFTTWTCWHCNFVALVMKLRKSRCRKKSEHIYFHGSYFIFFYLPNNKQYWWLGGGYSSTGYCSQAISDNMRSKCPYAIVQEGGKSHCSPQISYYSKY